MNESHGPHYGPWLAIGVAVPSTALVFVMARTWDHLTTIAVIAAVTAVAIVRSKLAASLHWEGTLNRRARDSARTIEVQGRALQSPPALTDGARAGYLEAQTEALRWELERNRAPAALDGPRIKVWDQVDDEGGWDGE